MEEDRKQPFSAEDKKLWTKAPSLLSRELRRRDDHVHSWGKLAHVPQHFLLKLSFKLGSRAAMLTVKLTPIALAWGEW